jgi:hypothetical protein
MIRALLFLAIALPAAAQQTQAPPVEPKKKEPERRPLNLRLDNPSSFATAAPEKEPKDLPALGGDARKLERGGPQPGERGSPFPKDSNPAR